MADKTEVFNYWKKRSLLLRETEQNMTVEYLYALESIYNSAIADAEKTLAEFYARLAANNEISITAARKYLTTSELPGFRMTLKEYQEMAEQMDLPEEYQKMLENASLKVRISRLEAAKIQLQHHATTLMKSEMDGMEYFLQGLYAHSYSVGAFEIFKGAGMTFTEVGVDADSVAKLIRKPWAIDGKNFSERVWGEHRPRLVNSLSTQLGKMVATGEAPDKTIKAIQKEFQTSKSAAVRLVQTESSFFAEQAKLDMYEDLEVEEYEFQSSLRERTCPECGALDGKHWKITEKEPGINFPPIHPNCTICTTIPYVDPAELENNTRTAKDKDGKTVRIPRNMKYDEWKELYLKGGKKGDTLPAPANKGFDKATLDYWERMKQIYRPDAVSVPAVKPVAPVETSMRKIPVQDAVSQIAKNGKYNKIIDTWAETPEYKAASDQYWDTRKKLRDFEWTDANDKEYKQLKATEKRQREYLNRYHESNSNSYMEQLAIKDHMEVGKIDVYQPDKRLSMGNDYQIAKDVTPHIKETHERFCRMFSDQYRVDTWGDVEIYASDSVKRANCSFGKPHINIGARETTVIDQISPNNKTAKPKEAWRVNIGTQVHETAHAMENANPHIRERCKEFLDYRTKDSKLVSMNEVWLNNPNVMEYEKRIFPNGPYGAHEMTKPDKFFSEYCGLQTGNGSTEIFSMGVQRVVENPIEFQKEDPEYFNFIVGLMRGEL